MRRTYLVFLFLSLGFYAYSAFSAVGTGKAAINNAMTKHAAMLHSM